ncbi:MAG: hypothetical protein ABFC80_00940 [Coriobacteriales bacterium]|nr:hypothetical protein [Actinomycetes bacterium]
MPRERAYSEWRPKRNLPPQLSALEARDIMFECCYTLHGPHFELTKSSLGIRSDEQRVKQSVKGMLRLAFKRVDGDYDRPTRDHLLKVIEVMSEQSLSWGTPEDVVDRHMNELRRVMARVVEA